MTYTLAVVQMQIAWRAPEQNLKTMENAIRKAAAAGADVVLFPEYALVGDLPKASESARYHKEYLAKLQALAETYQVDLIPGSMAEMSGKKIYNTAYYIDHRGKILGRYRKINLWHSERSKITAGQRVTVCDTRFGKVGLLICWDLIFPEVFRSMVKRGVEVVYCPSYWSLEDAGAGQKLDKNAEPKLVDAACILRAAENEIILAYCNPAKPQGDAGGSTTFGHSQITAPFIGALGKLDHAQERILIRKIDTSVLRIAASEYKIRQDLAK